MISAESIRALAREHGLDLAALALVGPRLPVAVPEWRVCSERLIAYPRLAGDPAAVMDPAAE